MFIIAKEDIEFIVGMRVRAVLMIVEDDVEPNAAAKRCRAGWTHCVPRDLGTVMSVNEGGDPNVRFDRTGTTTVCSPWELDIVPADPIPGLPFPQADDASRIMAMVDAVVDGRRTVSQIASHFGFNKRQSHYYGKAAAYLGLLLPVRGGYEPTADGRRFNGVKSETRKAMFVGAMLDAPVLRQAVGHLALTGTPPSVSSVRGWLAEHTALGPKTRNRRAQTVLAWCAWLAGEPGWSVAEA